MCQTTVSPLTATHQFARPSSSASVPQPHMTHADRPRPKTSNPTRRHIECALASDLDPTLELALAAAVAAAPALWKDTLRCWC